MTTPQILQPIPPGDGSGGVLPSSFAIGDILYADSTSTLKSLADVAVGSVLVSGGVGAAPAWSATSASKFGSVAIGGAVIGTNALAITGTAVVSGILQAGLLTGPNLSFTSNTATISWAGWGQLQAISDGTFQFANHNAVAGAYFTIPANAVWQFGNADAAVLVAQTIGVQNVVAGTTNTAGVTTTIRGSAGTGTGLGGNIVFQYAPHGSTGTAQNAFATALTINGDTALATFTGSVAFSTAASGIVLKQGANGLCGTFVANGVTPVTVSNTNVAITDAIIISLNTVGGTVGANPPDVQTITAGVGFTVKGLTLDTSTYNYAIIKNAA